MLRGTVKDPMSAPPRWLRDVLAALETRSLDDASDREAVARALWRAMAERAPASQPGKAPRRPDRR